jgi:hypothetical protein
MKIIRMLNIKVEILYEVDYLLFLFHFRIFYSACVSHVDVQKEETQLTIDPSTNRMLN